MRGGTANASVIASERVIGAPVVDRPNVLIAMNGPSLDAFEPKMQPGGLAIVNASLVGRTVERDDLRAIHVPATELANRLGSTATASVIMLAVYAAATGVVRIETLEEVIPHSLTRKDLIEVNLNAVEAGVDFVRQLP
jgi:2-oxoglutarate ferredoxin oxidoreductase subunit gamma